MDVHEATQASGLPWGWTGGERARDGPLAGLVQALFEQTTHGVIVCDRAGRLTLNAAARRIWGGAPECSDVAEWTRYRAFHPDGRPFAPEDWSMARALRSGQSTDPEHVQIERFDGARATILAGAAPIWGPGGEIEGAIGVFADVTSLVERADDLLQIERAAASRAERLLSFTAALVGTLTTERVASSVIEQGRVAVRALDASLWLVDPARGVAALAEASHGPDVRRRFAELRLDREGALPVVDAIRSARPVWLPTRAAFHAAYPSLPESAAYQRLPGLCVVTLPLLVAGRCAGALVFTYGEDRELDAAERVFLEVVAHHTSLALERARLFDAERAARAEAEAAQARSAFLSEAAHVLASSLDYEAPLASVARLAVPGIADWCAIDLAEDFWAGKPSAIVAHADPARVERARELQRRLPIDREQRRWVPEVLRTGRPELYPALTDEMLRALSTTPEHATAAIELEVRSAMVVPMAARGRVLGAITFVSSRPGRHGETDLEMARHLARRAGLAIDNARLYDEAQRAVHARKRVLSFVSHDLKNPLQAMMMAAAMLERGGDAEATRRHLAVLKRNGGRMDRLIRDLLDLSSLEAGRFTLAVQPFDAAALVADLVATQAPLAEHAGVALASEVAPDAGTAAGDRDRLLQVLANLVGNALAFTPRGGSVVVRCRREGAALRFEVQDSGKGIPAADQPRVFDAFWRSGESRQGTGLGLAIARGIVEAHGGTIALASEPGRGTTFFFTLPAADPVSAAAAP
jgi:signal transduction histidine kinase